MNHKIDIKSIITLQRINNNLLALIDNTKTQKDISLKQLLDQLYSPYEKINPNYREEHSFYNQYQMISSLYTYIVLPKESFFDLIPDKLIVSELNRKWGITTITPTYTLKKFIRRMRNEISNENIKFTQNLNFIFTDTNQRKPNDSFTITISQVQLSDFIQAFSYWCITEDVELKRL